MHLLSTRERWIQCGFAGPSVLRAQEGFFDGCGFRNFAATVARMLR